MEFDALTAGVKPGGLRSKQDIKLLICYLLSSIPQGLSKTDPDQCSAGQQSRQLF